ncbi:MAG: response regulator [Chthoniobacteraceae bacterium]
MNPKRILVIDDDEGLTGMVKLNLEATGDYEVRVENHSLQALETAREFRPDLILLDYVMPDLDGGDVTASLQNDPFLRSIPVIMVTALVSNQETGPDGTVRAGGQVMFAKPIKLANLLRCIEKHLAAAH